MKTLQAFWRWVDNEKPDTATVIRKACGNKALTPLARTAIDQAADVVWAMHKDSPHGFSLWPALDKHRDDLRDLSFALLPALEKVAERRTAAEPPKLTATVVITKHKRCPRCQYVQKKTRETCVNCTLPFAFPATPPVAHP